MPEVHRNAKAREAAQEYAPKPEGSSLTYGLIGVALLGLALVAFEMFYNANIFAYPAIIVLALLAVFLGSIILRKRRKRRYVAAFKDEYSKQDNTPPD